MQARQLVHVFFMLAGGCVNATYHAKTTLPLPPVADRAVVVDGASAAQVTARGQLVGTIDSGGIGDLDSHAASLAAANGGTHVVLTGSGVDTYTTTTPASETTSCTDYTDQSTCTTTYTPESTTTNSVPYADYNVYRVEPVRWHELGDLAPPAWDPDHHTPMVADGWGFAFGGFSAPFPGPASGTGGDVFPTSYTSNPAQLGGAWLASDYVSGSTEFAIDTKFGGASYDGMASNTQTVTQPVHYTGTIFGSALALRLGKRVTSNNLALAGGVGIGGALWMAPAHVDDPSAPVDATFVQPGPGVTADLYAPMWLGVTYKPSCNWGVQGLAEYDVRSDVETSTPSLALGLLWQPASACRG